MLHINFVGINFAVINFEIINFVTEPNHATVGHTAAIYTNIDQKENKSSEKNSPPHEKGVGEQG